MASESFFHIAKAMSPKPAPRSDSVPGSGADTGVSSNEKVAEVKVAVPVVSVNNSTVASPISLATGDATPPVPNKALVDVEPVPVV